MSQHWPLVSVIVETSTWHPDGHINLQDTLRALHEQTYPPDRLQIMVVLVPEHQERWQSIAHRFPGLTVVYAPSGLSYYQLKGQGLPHARGEIVALLDADNWVASDWIQEIVRPFLLDVNVIAVHGRSRFRESFLSRMWDTVWWERAYEPEGPIDRIFGANNLAFRREFLEKHFYDDRNPHRGVWERAMTHRVRSVGGTIWLNPCVTFFHDYHPRLLDFVQLALARGYHLLASRFKYPLGSEGLFRLFSPLTPWVVFPLLVMKDIWRILSRAHRTGLRWWELWKVPLYVLAYLPIEILVLIGMVLATTRRPAPKLP